MARESERNRRDRHAAFRGSGGRGHQVRVYGRQLPTGHPRGDHIPHHQPCRDPRAGRGLLPGMDGAAVNLGRRSRILRAGRPGPHFAHLRPHHHHPKAGLGAHRRRQHAEFRPPATHCPGYRRERRRLRRVSMGGGSDAGSRHLPDGRNGHRGRHGIPGGPCPRSDAPGDGPRADTPRSGPGPLPGHLSLPRRLLRGAGLRPRHRGTLGAAGRESAGGSPRLGSGGPLHRPGPGEPGSHPLPTAHRDRRRSDAPEAALSAAAR